MTLCGCDGYQIQNLRALPEIIRRRKPDFQQCSKCGKLVLTEVVILWNDKVFCEECYKELKELTTAEKKKEVAMRGSHNDASHVIGFADNLASA